MAFHAPMPPIDRLRELFLLDSKNGVLLHKKKCGIRSGTRAGSPMPQGYLRAKVDGRLLLVHRVIYAMHANRDPGKMEVDHINGDKMDNRPSNLRLATRNQNRQNCDKYSSNLSGYRGVWFDNARGAFFCAVQANGSREKFGPFASGEHAHKVYDAEARSRFGEFYREVKTND